MALNLRKKIGVVVPHGNAIHEREFRDLHSTHVDFQFESFAVPATNPSNYCPELLENLQEPIGRLRNWGAEAILLGCTAASMICGSDKQVAELETLAGMPVTTAARAASNAFEALSVRSLAIATPYGDKGNRTVSNFILGLGLDAVSIKGLEFDRSPEVWATETNSMTPEDMVDFIRSLDVFDADAIFLPCTGLISLATLQHIEDELKKIAISSVQAGYWAALKTIGLCEERPGYGQLLGRWP